MRRRKRVVFFLPYKASMWDSLESVWRAADKDADTDAYVMPIPYYDKAEDGSFTQMHWEEELFPADVPVVDYRQVNLQKIHPDMIFIHNPYDDGNVITSVDPAYYCDKLYASTDMLVYIPYFVHSEEKASMKSIEKFANTSAVVYAHKTIVQSSRIRDLYINSLSGIYGENRRSFFEERIVNWGSPKFDKVEKTRSNDTSIPVAWSELLVRADGKRKKVIFYNISLREMLANREKTIEKMKSVLNVFKRRRGEVVLIMRPHPLVAQAIATMAPSIQAEYEKIISKYVEEGWGIYDDTPDLNRAIAISDAYYGGGSSVVQLFRQVGKPVMLQNVEIL